MYLKKVTLITVYDIERCLEILNTPHARTVVAFDWSLKNSVK